MLNVGGQFCIAIDVSRDKAAAIKIGGYLESIGKRVGLVDQRLFDLDACGSHAVDGCQDRCCSKTAAVLKKAIAGQLVAFNDPAECLVDQVEIAVDEVVEKMLVSQHKPLDRFVGFVDRMFGLLAERAFVQVCGNGNFCQGHRLAFWSLRSSVDW